MTQSIGKKEELYFDMGMFGETPKSEDYDEAEVTKRLAMYASDNKGYVNSHFYASLYNCSIYTGYVFMYICTQVRIPLQRLLPESNRVRDHV
jgi:hypothetical protein